MVLAPIRIADSLFEAVICGGVVLDFNTLKEVCDVISVPYI